MTDFTLVLDFLNSHGSVSLSPTATPTARVDCNFDGIAALIDALRVINHLKSLSAAGEGRGGGISGRRNCVVGVERWADVELVRGKPR